MYGLEVPRDISVMGKDAVAAYNEDFSGHEQDFLLAAREHGLERGLVGELRDAGIRMVIEAEGQAVTEEVWNAMAKRFAGRLTTSQFGALKAWWRGSVEKGA